MHVISRKRHGGHVKNLAGGEVEGGRAEGAWVTESHGNSRAEGARSRFFFEDACQVTQSICYTQARMRSPGLPVGAAREPLARHPAEQRLLLPLRVQRHRREGNQHIGFTLWISRPPRRGG